MIVFFQIFFNQIDTIPEKSLLVIVLGVVLLCTHAYSFRYLINKSTIYLSLMLPVTVMMVTQTIATNLYLSLGLVGALSIVRYRTPVKSQYELAYLFALIGMGVIAGVKPSYAIFLTVVLSAIPIGYNIFKKFLPQVDGSDLRVNSNGRSDLSISLALKDLADLDTNPVNGRLIRSDFNYEQDEAFFLLSFDTHVDASSFQANLTFRPKTISITVG
jgi:hypothetical protein